MTKETTPPAEEPPVARHANVRTVLLTDRQMQMLSVLLARVDIKGGEAAEFLQLIAALQEAAAPD